jgi:hypothetical protein
MGAPAERLSAELALFEAERLGVVVDDQSDFALNPVVKDTPAAYQPAEAVHITHDAAV